MMAGWRLEHTYAGLPQIFYAPAAPTPVREPRLLAFNRPLAGLLGLDPDALAGPEGAGRTRYSRRGDGCAALGPMLREYIISEAMYALGIPTTRSLAVAATGDPVYREEVMQGAVLTRVAASHIRVGTMQWAASQRDDTSVRALADYTLARHYPELADASTFADTSADKPNRYMALFDAILARQASLIARWQLVGFI